MSRTSNSLTKTLFLCFLSLIVFSVSLRSCREGITRPRTPAPVSMDVPAVADPAARPAQSPPVPVRAHFDKVDLEEREAVRGLERARNRFAGSQKKLAVNKIYTRSMKRAADRAADRATEEILRLVVLMARDKVKGSDETRAELRTIVQQETRSWLAGYTRDLKRLGEAHQQEVEEELFELSYALATVSVSGEEGFELTSVSQLQAEDVDLLLRDLGIDASISGTFLAMDLIALKDAALVRNIVVRVQAVLGRMFGKQIAKVAAGGGAALLDGPLPFGDALLVGALAWTAYDIHQGREDFRDNVRNATLSALQRARRELHQQAVDRVKENQDEAVQAVAKLTDRARAQLKTLQQNPGTPPSTPSTP